MLGRGLRFAIARDITDRRDVEDELRHVKERYRLATAAGQAATWEFDIASARMETDGTLEALIGYEAGELETDASWAAVTHPDDLPSLARFWGAVCEGRVARYDVEHRMIHRDGSARWFEIRASAVRDASGRVVAVAGTTHDITERRKAQDELRVVAEVNAALSELSRALIAPAAHVQEVSDRTLAVARALTTSEHGYVSVVDTETGDNVSYTLTAMMKTECTLSGDDLRLAFRRRPDGKYPRLWGHALNRREGFFTNDAAGHEAAGGTPPGHIPVRKFLSVPVIVGDELVGQIALINPLRDYTAADLAVVEQIAVIYGSAVLRKRADDALAESARRFRAVFDNAAVGIARASLDGRITEINAEFCRIIGYSAEEVLSVGLTYQQLTFPDDLESDLAQVQALLDGVSDRYAMEKRYVRKDGGVVWANLSVQVVRRAAGEPWYFIGAVTDISSRKHAEELLRASLAEKEVLLKEVHHRVKNNMAVVTSLLRLQEKRTGTVEVKEALRDAQGRVMTMALVHETVYQSASLAGVELDKLLRRIGDSLVRIYGSRALLRVEAEPIHVVLDQAVPLGLAITELLTNSFKYAFPDGRRGNIVVSARRNGDGIDLRISDDGVGLSANVDWGTSHTLGLGLVRALVTEQLGGTLEVGPGPGTQFAIAMGDPARRET